MKAFFLILLCLMIAGYLTLKYKYLVIKGKIGEIKISTRLFFLPKNKYTVLNDLFFKFGDYSAQIDHIVVSKFGVFVIETKSYKGWIFGNSHKDKWTQNLWGNKYSLFNPIFQNESHINFLKKNFHELSLAANYIYPVVVFLNANRLVLYGDCDCVVWGSELNDYIKSFKREVLSPEYCKQITSILSNSNIQNKKLRQQHRKWVSAAKAFSEDKVANGICPRCGGKLILRNGRYGSFFGCSNYPSCKYTHNM